MKVKPARHRGEQARARRIEPPEEARHVFARPEVQEASQLPVDRVLDDDVDDLQSQVYQRMQLIGRLGAPVADGEDGLRPAASLALQRVAVGGRQDALTCGAQDRDVLDDGLAAHAELGGELSPGDRTLGPPKPCKEGPATRRTQPV